ncbi:cytoplasmic protein [Kwoniella heveanensis CBS 569]|uniref:Cytoplasmic protein n=1 Tax=Kwoniella heveanensis BCC8398 TaxID=1296120 RepID=A0A1B9GP12_9TREE|nr:cytoplasmic protein [Kwoniella heveanensis BCC8398]OCF38438.1 cytoplasmic protein [Kwoniella heveanensis CBS 569]
MSSKSPVLILTGASRGLGLAVLRILLTKHNARVATLSRTITPELKGLADEVGQDRILPVRGDVSKPEDNVRAVEETANKWGQVDGLVLNAGTIDPGKIADLPTSSLIPYVQTNLLSTIYLVQPALPYLRKSKGKVVLVSSGASTTGYQAWGLYSMAKAGMNSLARTLAAEERENGVSVYAIRPGMVNTDMQALLRDKGPSSMHPSEMVKFQSAFEKGELLPPEQPGAIIAGLAVAGPNELSGEYINWADERLQSLA